jgi:hypothetical protein
MMVSFALTFNLRGLLFLIGAVVLGVVAVALLAPAPRPNWPLGAVAAALCLGFVGWFLWAAGA